MAKDIESTTNCRFCDKMSQWEFAEEHDMNAFVCAYYEKKYKHQDNAVWVYPDMVFYCKNFERAGTTVESVRKLEEKLYKLEKKNEALEKELKQYQE